jgi:hypothetical protein
LGRDWQRTTHLGWSIKEKRGVILWMALVSLSTTRSLDVAQGQLLIIESALSDREPPV